MLIIWHTLPLNLKPQHHKNEKEHQHHNISNLFQKTCTLWKELDGILRIPEAGSIFSCSGKATSGRNHAHVTWTHKPSISVGFRAPPATRGKKTKRKGRKLIPDRRISLCKHRRNVKKWKSLPLTGQRQQSRTISGVSHARQTHEAKFWTFVAP